MSEENKNSMGRRDALLTMMAGSAGLMVAGSEAFANGSTPSPAPSNAVQGFHTAIPFKVAGNTKVPYGLNLYGDCNGALDIILSDFTPSLNKYGQFIDDKGNVVASKKDAKLTPSKNILLYGRALPGPEDYGDSPVIVETPDGPKPRGADFGGHYHKDTEVIYCPNGMMLVEIRENSGQQVVDFEGDTVLEERAPDAGSRQFQYMRKAGDKTQIVDLTDDVQQVILERGGMVTVPGYAFHSVIMLATGDMVAYLPDGKRWAEKEVSDPTPGAVCQHDENKKKVTY